ncbi:MULTISPECIES: sugar ABC transporter permease [unclassified Mycoplasma]|uniref:sugar ABC transporter permease n=1 Tax=unclassified Mycoplasma TaxID=2683645 RepID=UPI00211C93FD|nr:MULTISPECIES: sugar ABC transporter permease [unclassified Mycoplasma]UUM19902.1 sugar ABC transporter permease [Mycoplasma sp. 1578d]UUM24882.1 sugar ABC transporter permease [Mycoplasma sp. 3686d]
MKKLQFKWDKQKARQYGIASLYILPLFVIVFIFYIYPIINTISESFITFPSQTKKFIYQYGINNYQRVFIDPNFQIAISNSTFLFFVPTFFSLLFSITIAYSISALTLRRSKNFFLKLIYSQFFISSFTVGLAFILLFGQENLFFRLFHSNKSFIYGSDRLSIKFYFLIFQLWRSMPFNIVIFSFIFSRINEKYRKLIKVDNLSFFDKLKYLYYQEFSKSFILVTYTNLVFSFLMFPGAIMEESKVVSTQGHTLASYVFQLTRPFGGALTVDANKAYAASVITILYLLFLFIVTWFGFFIVKMSVKKILNKKQRR